MLVVWEGWWGLGSGGGDIGRGRGDGVNHELFFVDYYHGGRELGAGEVSSLYGDGRVGSLCEFIWGTARCCACSYRDGTAIPDWSIDEVVAGILRSRPVCTRLRLCSCAQE